MQPTSYLRHNSQTNVTLVIWSLDALTAMFDL
jgi:hypothetical protein